MSLPSSGPSPTGAALRRGKGKKTWLLWYVILLLQLQKLCFWAYLVFSQESGQPHCQPWFCISFLITAHCIKPRIFCQEFQGPWTLINLKLRSVAPIKLICACAPHTTVIPTAVPQVCGDCITRVTAWALWSHGLGVAPGSTLRLWSHAGCASSSENRKLRVMASPLPSLWGLAMLRNIKCLEQGKAHRKHSGNVSCFCYYSPLLFSMVHVAPLLSKASS